MAAPDEIKANGSVKKIIKATGLVKVDPPTLPFINTLSTLFDGVDEFAETAGDVPSLDGFTNCTWSLWYKQVTQAGAKDLLTKFDFGTRSTWAFESTNGGGEFRMYMASSNNDTGPPLHKHYKC